jgi:hypothetical protein
MTKISRRHNKSFIIDQYFTDCNLFPATRFGPHGTIIRHEYSYIYGH